MKGFDSWSKNIESRTKELPLPAEIANIKGVIVVNVPERGVTIKAHKGANLNRAFVEKFNGKSFRVGLYDKVSKQYPAGRIFSAKELKDGVFGLYLVTRKPVTLTPSTICYGGSWYMNFNVGAAAVQRDNAESLAQKFYIFVSLKEEKGQIFSDRAYIVPEKNCPAELLKL